MIIVCTGTSSLHIIPTRSLRALNVRIIRDGKDSPVRSASKWGALVRVTVHSILPYASIKASPQMQEPLPHRNKSMMIMRYRKLEYRHGVVRVRARNWLATLGCQCVVAPGQERYVEVVLHS